MSERNVELTRLGYDLVNRGDIDAMLERCTPDVEWRETGELEPEVYSGVDGVRAYFQRVLDPWEHLERIPEEIIDLGGERVLVLWRMTARGKESGLDVEMSGADLLTIRDEKLVVWESYWDRDQAREAAGLSE
jgi:ketosteroid isomerase-like protein